MNVHFNFQTFKLCPTYALVHILRGDKIIVTADEEPAIYIGSDDCLDCHKIWKEQNLPLVRTGHEFEEEWDDEECAQYHVQKNLKGLFFGL